MSPSTQPLAKLIEGFRSTALIAAAVRLKLLDAMDEAPRSAREIAAGLKLNEQALTRFLRGLALLEIVEENVSSEGLRYTLTPSGRLLRSDAGNPLANYALLSLGQYLPAWARTEIAVRDGANPFQSVFGQTVWSYRKDHPGDGAIFNQWLHAQSSTVADDIAAALDLTGHVRVADVGGGQGTVLACVLRRFPGCRGVLAEQPAVLAAAEPILRKSGVLDRCDLLPTDFFLAVPGGCDAYLLKSVLHDWDDADSIRILSSLRAAMTPETPLFIIERHLPMLAQDDPATVWVDLMMMNVSGGRERTLREYESLLHRSRLRLARTTLAAAGFQVMEAVRDES